MAILYGIKNCDTMKKAMKWLADHGINAELHDYRTDGLDPQWLAETADKLGWENLINKRSTTWRNLDDSIKQNLNQATVLQVLTNHPTLIKRPILLHGETLLLGFDEQAYRQLVK